MKKTTLITRLLALLLLCPLIGRADEGMWLPLLLKQLNESDMQKRGHYDACIDPPVNPFVLRQTADALHD